MANDWLIACSAGMAAAGLLAGCSGSDAAERPPGSVPVGTAEIAINGAQADSTRIVDCSSAGATTMIKTGDENSGTTSAVDTAGKLTVQFAKLRNVDGFTGSYWDQLGPPAEVHVTGGTFMVRGTASGYTEENPSARVLSTFTIKVAC